MRMVKGLEGRSYEEELRSSGLFSLKETEGRPHGTYDFIWKGKGWAGTDILYLVTSDRTPEKGLKMCQVKSRLDIRKRFFTQVVFGHWNRPQGNGHSTKLARVQEESEQYSQAHGMTF
ncbi:hypothetical protein TURU_122208 [Turdus rufiventris]|nr:hypothetical protein TURU_122208 [Turdus rufiventris]